MERFESEWLVIGADGLIGRALADYLENTGKHVLETTRSYNTVSEKRSILDLSVDIADWQPAQQFSVAYLCAAVSSLDHCRREQTRCAMINVHNTVALAKKLVAKGVFVVFPSTNLVYNGSIPFRKADDTVCPVTEYGRQKAEAERLLLALGDMISVLRFTKVLGPDNLLINGWIKALQNHKVIHPFSDLVMAPIPLSFAVNVLHHIAVKRLSGIVQVSGEKDVTYEQIARDIAQRIGADPDLVQPVRSKEAGVRLEALPSYTTLDTTRLRTELGIEPPDVWETIDSVFGI